MIGYPVGTAVPMKSSYLVFYPSAKHETQETDTGKYANDEIINIPSYPCHLCLIQRGDYFLA